MRSLAILLLLLNLLYLGWNLGRFGFSGRQTESEIIVRPAGVQAPERLLLLSELDESLPRLDELAAVAEISDEGLPETAVPDPSLCSEVEGFADRAVAEAFAEQLRELGYAAEVEQAVQETSTFRVFMPPFASAAGRNQTLAELQGRGIESFIMTSGELAQGISLGVFSTEAAAAALQEQLAAQGYASSIREQVRASGDIRVQTDQVATLVQTLEAWQLLLAENDGLNLAEKLCETIAPED